MVRTLISENYRRLLILCICHLKSWSLSDSLLLFIPVSAGTNRCPATISKLHSKVKDLGRAEICAQFRTTVDYTSVHVPSMILHTGGTRKTFDARPDTRSMIGAKGEQSAPDEMKSTETVVMNT